jgi:hypothetical protein
MAMRKRRRLQDAYRFPVWVIEFERFVGVK